MLYRMLKILALISGKHMQNLCYYRTFFASYLVNRTRISLARNYYPTYIQYLKSNFYTVKTTTISQGEISKKKHRLFPTAIKIQVSAIFILYCPTAVRESVRSLYSMQKSGGRRLCYKSAAARHVRVRCSVERESGYTLALLLSFKFLVFFSLHFAL